MWHFLKHAENKAKCCHTQPGNDFDMRHYWWLPLNKMDRPLTSWHHWNLWKNGGQMKTKGNSVKVQSVKNKNKNKKRHIKSSISEDKLVIVQYQVAEPALSNFDIKILNNEATSYYPQPQFANMIHAKFGVAIPLIGLYRGHYLRPNFLIKFTGHLSRHCQVYASSFMVLEVFRKSKRTSSIKIYFKLQKI